MNIEPDINRLALLVVDAQRDYLDPAGGFAQHGWDQPTAAGVTALSERIGRLVAAFHDAGRPVVFAETRLRADAADAAFPQPWMVRLREAGGNILVDGSEGAAPVEGLAPAASDYVIAKQGPGAFHGTNLDRLL